MSELSYNTISSVIESWERLKRIRNYQEVTGATVFQRYARETNTFNSSTIFSLIRFISLLFGLNTYMR